MNKMKPLYACMCLSTLLMIGFGCTSSKKLLKQGAYYEAVLTATDKLKKNPGHDKTQKALRMAYPLAVQHFKEQIHKAKVTKDQWQWSLTADAYQSLNTMYEAIQSTPKARQIVSNPKSFYEQYAQVKGKAAQEQYKAGDHALSDNTREGAREAYYYFQRADQYVAGYQDVEKKMREAKDKATLKVVIDPVPVPSRFYKVSGDFFYNQVTQHLKNKYGQNSFIAFYTPHEANKWGIDVPDQILELRFEDFTVGQTNTSRHTENITKDSVKVGEITMEDGTKKPVYGEVSAKLTTHHIQVISGGILSMIVLDGQNHGVLLNDEMEGQFTWVDEWATYQGDKRALTGEQLHLCGKRASVPPPPQDLFVEFTKPIYDQLTNRIYQYYRGYI